MLVLTAVFCACLFLAKVFQGWRTEFAILALGAWVFGGVLSAGLVVFTDSINRRQTQTIIDGAEPDCEYIDDVSVLLMGPARKDLPRFPYRRLPTITARTCLSMFREVAVPLNCFVSDLNTWWQRLKRESDDNT
jgi:hypothetical protein